MGRIIFQVFTAQGTKAAWQCEGDYLSALFGKTVKMGFADKLNQIRIDRACDYFAAGGKRSCEVAYQMGFKDEKYFSSVFKKLKGEGPSAYRKRKSAEKQEQERTK